MTTQDDGQDRVSRLSGGFNRIVRDFDRALHLARLSSSQLLLIQQAREESWSRPQIEGKGEPEPFRLNVSEIASMAGLERSRLNKQHQGLVSKGVFLELGDGRFLINKDYPSWVESDGSPLLSRDQINYCKQVRRKVRSEYSGTQAPRVKYSERLCRPEYLGTHKPRKKYSAPDNRHEYLGTQFPEVPIEERADARSPACAELNSEREREEEKPRLPSRASGVGPLAASAGGTEGEALAWTLERVSATFPGDESLAEHVPMWIRSAARDGHSLVEIQDIVSRGLLKGDARRFLGFIRACFTSPRQAPSPRVDTGPAAPSKVQALADGFDEWARSRKETL